MSEKQKSTQFKEGNEGGRKKRSYSKRKVGLTLAYSRGLTSVVPDSGGKTYAEVIAMQIIEKAASGDVGDIMTILGYDAKGKVKKAIDRMVEEEQVSEALAAAALSLFYPQMLVAGYKPEFKNA